MHSCTRVPPLSRRAALRVGLGGAAAVAGRLGRSGATAARPDATAAGSRPQLGPPRSGLVEVVWQSAGGPDLPLDKPAHPTLDSQGNLWVPDGGSNRFQIFAPDGAFREAWGTPGAAPGQFDFRPGYVPLLGTGGGGGAAAFDAAGTLYVADTGNRRVQKFGPDRRFLTAWGGGGRGDGRFVSPTDIAVDAQGRVFVLDAGRADPRAGAGGTAVQVFDGNGGFLFAWGGFGDGAGELFDPFGLALDGEGAVWVADFNNNRLQKFAPDGAFLTAVGKYGHGEGELRWPTDAAVDARGYLYAADRDNARVQVFAPDGRYLAAWGTMGTGAGQFLNPVGIALDHRGHAYVVDAGRVQAFRLLPPSAPDFA